MADWHQRQPEGFNGRVRQPLGWNEFLCEELRRLATAIDLGAREIEKHEDRSS